MKVSINFEGYMQIVAENPTEQYALKKFVDDPQKRFTYEFGPREPEIEKQNEEEGEGDAGN